MPCASSSAAMASTPRPSADARPGCCGRRRPNSTNPAAPAPKPASTCRRPGSKKRPQVPPSSRPSCRCMPAGRGWTPCGPIRPCRTPTGWPPPSVKPRPASGPRRTPSADWTPSNTASPRRPPRPSGWPGNCTTCARTVTRRAARPSVRHQGWVWKPNTPGTRCSSSTMTRWPRWTHRHSTWCASSCARAWPTAVKPSRG